MTQQKVYELGEQKLIELISKILGGLGNNILSGEDDAVAVAITESAGATLIFKTDMLVSTTDIPQQMTLYEAARKAVIMNVSDVFVKGGIPRWAVVSLGIPSNLDVFGEKGFQGIIEGLNDTFNKYNVKYLGGDLNDSQEIIISVTLIGTSAFKNKFIPRSGAKVGDLIISTDQFGKTGCGFEILLKSRNSEVLSKTQKENFIKSVLRPETAEGYSEILLKNGWVSASSDSSDGVQKTINDICRASNVSAELYIDMLPIADGVVDFAKEQSLKVEQLIFRSGEEYLHIYTIPSEKFDEAYTYFKERNKPFYLIGRIIEKTTKLITLSNFEEKQAQQEKVMQIDEKKEGYEHFSPPESDPELQTFKDQDISPKESISCNEATISKIQEDEILPDNLNYDMPLYRQYEGSCGLSSLLMALKPESRKMDSILDLLWDRIRPIFGHNSIEGNDFRWQYVLEWLLFQIPKNESLKSILTKGFGEHFTDEMLPMLIYNIKRVVKISGKGVDVFRGTQDYDEYPITKISKNMLMDRIKDWKQHYELIMLAYLFGCRFIPWEKNNDGTGSIAFEEKESIKNPSSYIEKIRYLIQFLKKERPILCGDSIHWISIKNIKKMANSQTQYLITYHEPNMRTEREQTSDYFLPSERFYLFEFSEDLFHQNSEILKTLQ